MRKKTREQREANKAIRDRFLIDFADEVNLYDLQKHFPEWVYTYHEVLLGRIGDTFCTLCRTLKDGGVDFKIKYPVEVDGKWKYADIFIPKSNIIVLLIQDFETIGLPCHSKTDREMWFDDRYKTLAMATIGMRYATRWRMQNIKN